MVNSRSAVLSVLVVAFVLAAVVVAVPARAEVGVGDKAPNFQLSGLDGKSVKLSDYSGKPTLVVFWASWCPHCQREVPVLQKVYGDLKGKGANAVGVSVDRDLSDAKDFAKDYKITFRNAFAGNEAGMGVVDAYGVEGVPTIYVIDKNGNIAAKHVGEVPESTIREDFAKLGVK